MLGHKLVQTLRAESDVYTMIRSWHGCYDDYGIFEKDKTIVGIDINDFDSVVRVVGNIKPDVIVNGVGVIKQLPTAKDPVTSIKINALFPHQIAALCRAARIRFIHVSTDCVFDGKTGGYLDDDVSNATDLYGRSKFLGEVDGDHCLTLRTSIIGRELRSASGLVEWFLSQRGTTANGYKHAIFSGLTTDALSKTIAEVIEKHPQLCGIYQVSSEPINKFDLLSRIKSAMNLDVDLIGESDFRIDRSLNSDRFQNATGIETPSWDELIEGLADDSTPYESVRASLRQ